MANCASHLWCCGNAGGAGEKGASRLTAKVVAVKWSYPNLHRHDLSSNCLYLPRCVQLFVNNSHTIKSS